MLKGNDNSKNTEKSIRISVSRKETIWDKLRQDSLARFWETPRRKCMAGNKFGGNNVKK
jgi:hypothetical protein